MLTLYEIAIAKLAARGFKYNRGLGGWVAVMQPMVLDKILKAVLRSNDPQELPRICASDYTKHFGYINWTNLVKPLLVELMEMTMTEEDKDVLQKG